jgi:predicted Ser/Thr protein kinase
LHPILIDFERAKKTTNPQNVSQFIQFLTSRGFGAIFNEKRIKISKSALIGAVKDYKKEQNKENFHKILEKIQ